jgi:hypothetical protein
MASFFYINLDLESPKLEISAPNYTTQNIYNDIFIYSNEKLSDFQEIYIIDKNGARHDLIFAYDNNKFIGKVKFSIPVGIATIYARLKDIVDNVSDLYSKTIEVKESNTFTLEIASKNKKISLNRRNRNIDLKLQDRDMKLGLQDREIKTNLYDREIIIKKNKI